MGSNYNNKVHFNDSTGLDIDSGGQIATDGTSGVVIINSGGEIQVKSGGAINVETYGNLSLPVLGTTVFASTEVGTGTTVPNTGTVILTQNQTTTPRTFTVEAPVKGCFLDIIIASTASTDCQIDFNLGSGVGVLNAGTTSVTWIIASTDKSPSTYRALGLVGLSTALWGVRYFNPTSTGWLFAATSS